MQSLGRTTPSIVSTVLRGGTGPLRPTVRVYCVQAARECLTRLETLRRAIFFQSHAYLSGETRSNPWHGICGTPNAVSGAALDVRARMNTETARRRDEGYRMNTFSESKPVEGPVARAIEKKTSKIPSDVFLWAALGFLGVSVAMRAGSRRGIAPILSELGPTLLLLGVYNKLVKVAGSDQYDQTAAFPA